MDYLVIFKTHIIIIPNHHLEMDYFMSNNSVDRMMNFIIMTVMTILVAVVCNIMHLRH